MAAVLTNGDDLPGNPVEYEIVKLKKQTTKVHRYFDAGEFIMSRTELEWLRDALRRNRADLIGYIASVGDDRSVNDSGDTQGREE